MIDKVVTENFQAEVLEASEPVLVDFSATWCGPCKAAEPIVERVANSYLGKAKVVKVDIDDSPELANQFQVRGVPTFIFVKNGEEVDRLVGLTGKNLLQVFSEKLDSLLG